MGTVVDWTSIGKSSLKRRNNPNGNMPELKFLRIKKGETVTVRLLGRPVHYYKYVLQHNGKWRSAIVGDENDAANCPVGQKYNLDPAEKYSVNVIDRADKQLKIFEGAPTVFAYFQNWAEITGENPGGSNGGDFKITATGKKGKDYYEVKFLGRKPFTKEERVLLKTQGLYKLENIFKALTPEEIEQTLFEGQPPAPSQPQPVAQKELDDETAELLGEEPTPAKAEKSAPAAKGGDSESDEIDDVLDGKTAGKESGDDLDF